MIHSTIPSTLLTLNSKSSSSFSSSQVDKHNCELRYAISRFFFFFQSPFCTKLQNKRQFTYYNLHHSATFHRLYCLSPLFRHMTIDFSDVRFDKGCYENKVSYFYYFLFSNRSAIYSCDYMHFMRKRRKGKHSETSMKQQQQQQNTVRSEVPVCFSIVSTHRHWNQLDIKSQGRAPIKLVAWIDVFAVS